MSPMGGNVRDDKRWDHKVISTTMEVGSSDIGYGKDVQVSGGMKCDV